MTTRKSRKIVIQIAIIMAFVFSLITAYIAINSGSLTLGLIFLTTLEVVVLLAILFVLETILELMEVKV